VPSIDVSSRLLRVLTALTACVLVGGCSGISIEPACPQELFVGESGPVFANAENEGEIATFLWEVFPTGAGTFADPAEPDTTFEAAEAGTVVIRLTASDGLFMVISECSTLILPAVDVAVVLEASATTVEAGQEVTLTCTSNGDSEATTRAIEQVSGDVVTLTDVAEGVVSFTPVAPGTFEFVCVGEDAEGMESDPASLTVTVTEPTNANDNTSDGNSNDNDTPPDNENDNSRGGRGSNR
jgi:plastocyanin